MFFIDTFKQDSNGVFVPHIRDDEDRRLQQVVAAPQPGPSYWFLKAPEKELGIIGNRGGGKTHTMVLKLLSPASEEDGDRITTLSSFAHRCGK